MSLDLSALSGMTLALVTVLSDRPIEEHGTIRVHGCRPGPSGPAIALQILTWPHSERAGSTSALERLLSGEACLIDYAASWDPDASARLRSALTEAATRAGRTVRGCMNAKSCTHAAEARCRIHDGMARADLGDEAACLTTCRDSLATPYVETCFELVEARPAAVRRTG